MDFTFYSRSENSEKNDGKDQKYVTPKEAMTKGVDVLVGRYCRK